MTEGSSPFSAPQVWTLMRSSLAPGRLQDRRKDCSSCCNCELLFWGPYPTDSPERRTIFYHIAPVFIKLHCIPISAHIKFKSLKLAYKVLIGSAPNYLSTLIKACYPTTTPLNWRRSCSSPNTSYRAIQAIHMDHSILVEWATENQNVRVPAYFRNALEDLSIQRAPPAS